MPDTYDKRGVSASKEAVHAAIRHLDKGIFPNAFCKILPDMAAGDPAWCNLLHADTAGTKTSLAYLYWKETGDMQVWSGIAQDALVMNLDDMACVGCTDHFILSNTIGRNRNRIPGAVIEALIRGTTDFIESMAAQGITMHLAGGETADVGDIVRTLDVGFTAFARMPRASVISVDIRPGDVVVGLASFGRATYEKTFNAGMGSNGLTSARHDILSKYYASKYPESFDPELDIEVVYTGTHLLTDRINLGDSELSVGEMLLSPTRTYLPVIHALLQTHRKQIHGLIHCTGGGQTKALKFIRSVRVVKDNLFPIPTLFQLIHDSGTTPWEEMYKVFNMGHRLEVYTDRETADQVIRLAADYGIDARVVGHVEPAGQPEVVVDAPSGTFLYR